MKVKHTKIQQLIELITITLLLFMCLYLIFTWNNLPSRIPVHYNGSGMPDRFGDKNEILFMPIISIVIYTILTVVSFFPSTWNVPVKITNKNREFVYKNLSTMLTLLKMKIILIFTYMGYSQINTQSLAIWCLPLVLIMVFGTIGYYLIKVCLRR